MNITYLREFELMSPDDVLLDRQPMKPRNTRTRKTAWKERRRLSNASRSIQKRMLKRI